MSGYRLNDIVAKHCDPTDRGVVTGFVTEPLRGRVWPVVYWPRADRSQAMDPGTIYRDGNIESAHIGL